MFIVENLLELIGPTELILETNWNVMHCSLRKPDLESAQPSAVLGPHPNCWWLPKKNCTTEWIHVTTDHDLQPQLGPHESKRFCEAVFSSPPPPDPSSSGWHGSLARSFSTHTFSRWPWLMGVSFLNLAVMDLICIHAYLPRHLWGPAALLFR